jgi:hypothetical protein
MQLKMSYEEGRVGVGRVGRGNQKAEYSWGKSTEMRKDAPPSIVTVAHFHAGKVRLKLKAAPRSLPIRKEKEDSSAQVAARSGGSIVFTRPI